MLHIVWYLQTKHDIDPAEQVCQMKVEQGKLRFSDFTGDIF